MSEIQETEIVIYSKIGNMAGLNEADSVEEHIQLETESANNVRSRVRKTTKGNFIKNELTFKVDEVDKEVDSSIEISTIVNEAFFEGFKHVATKQVVKTRYTFDTNKLVLTVTENGETRSITVPNIKYEVDVYKRTDGSVCEWCKIDIEVDRVLEFLQTNHPDVKDLNFKVKISHLPFNPTESMISGYLNPEQERFISALWDNDFNQKVVL
jgi:hypothetical protein